MEKKNQHIRSNKYVKIITRLLLGYVGLVALVLALAIITIMVTFTIVVAEGFTGSHALGQFSESYFVPVSEFFWALFMTLIPGL